MRLLPLLLVACTVEFESQKGDSANGEDDCAILAETTWALSGDLYDDPPSATLNYSSTDCSFSLSGWTDEESDLPSGGVISGYDVTFDGAGAWADCTGLVEGTYLVSGDCTDIGAWTLSGN